MFPVIVMFNFLINAINFNAVMSHSQLIQNNNNNAAKDDIEIK